ncbi:hypothetical protein ACFL6C_04980 [Myxococcota bacterium]
MARPGDVVCFAAGTYRGFEVKNVRASVDEPLVFRTVPGAEREATFTSRSLKHGYGVWIGLSEHVHVYDLRLTELQTGIGLWSSAYNRIEGLLVESVGQAAIHVGRKHNYSTKRFLGPTSHHCDVIGNWVRDTGKVTARYGEGVYIGTGRMHGDDTHEVFVAYNRFEEVRAEAIELKPFTYNNVVRGNLVINSSHIFHGAITVAVQAPPSRDGNFIVEDNRIYNYASTESSVAGISVGHGNGIVRNNLVWAIEGGRGIRTTTTFANRSARGVLIESNTVWSPSGAPSISLHDGDERTGVTDLFGDITVRDNVTDDGSAGSTKVGPGYFVGPIEGTADAGQGPGSGFRAKQYAGVGADVSRVVGH